MADTKVEGHSRGVVASGCMLALAMTGRAAA